MRRGFTIAMALVVVCGLGVVAVQAGPGCGKHAQQAKASCCSKATGQQVEFPAMVTLVGDKTYQCGVSAAEAAKEANTHVMYGVCDKKFETKGAAMVALASASEEYAEKFMTIACVVDGKLVYCDEKECSAKGKTASKTCSKAKTSGGTQVADAGKSSCGSHGKAAKVAGSGCCSKGHAAKASGSGCCAGGKAAKVSGSGCCSKGHAAKASASSCCSGAKVSGSACCAKAKTIKGQCSSKCSTFMVLGRKFDSYEAAVKAREAACSAAKKIKMTYVVDGEEVHEASHVCPMAKSSGKVKYVVNDEKTSCEISARIALAKARYEAAKSAATKLASL